jgi:hypothetical protein
MLWYFLFQFWSIFVSCSTQHINSVQRTLEQIDTIKKFTHKYPSFFKFVTSAEGKIARFSELNG